jgi:hypothetical protein
MVGLELSGPAATLVLTLPFLILFAVIFWVTSRRRRHPQAETAPAAEPVAPERQAKGRYGEPLAPPRAAEPLAAARPQPVTPPADIDRIDAEIARVGASRDETRLAELHLAAGRANIARGDIEAAVRHLTQSVKLASANARKDAHADARLELGDLARRTGDLTTACEHWQLARGLFLELKKPDRLAQVEERMRDNGCPTDWVLNDF